MKIVFVAYNYQPLFKDPEQWTQFMYLQVNIMEQLAKDNEVFYVREVNYEGVFEKNNVSYIYPRKTVRKSYFPFVLHKTIGNLKPQLVVVLGFRYPLQIIQLRKKLGKNVVIVARDHQDKVPSGFRQIIQRMVDKKIDAYLFTAKENATQWIKKKVIGDVQKVKELPATSTVFERMDKDQSREKLGWGPGIHCLWVGRLAAEKDPLTILKGFATIIQERQDITLHFIYQENRLEAVLKEVLEKNPLLADNIRLHGFVPNKDLAAWCSAADIFISGSHRESVGYSLLEAMACGCVPVVAKIPTSFILTGEGRFGFLFRPGDADDFVEKLKMCSNGDLVKISNDVEAHFKKHLSPEAIAHKLIEIYQDLSGG